MQSAPVISLVIMYQMMAGAQTGLAISLASTAPSSMLAEFGNKKGRRAEEEVEKTRVVGSSRGLQTPPYGLDLGPS